MKNKILLILLIISIASNIYFIVHRLDKVKSDVPLSQITIHSGTKMSDVIKIIGREPDHIVKDLKEAPNDQDIFFIIFNDDKESLYIYFDENLLSTNAGYDNY